MTALRRPTLLASALAIVALSASACAFLPGASPDTRSDREREIALQAAKWASAGIDSYTFTITRSCFCPPESSGPFEVTVESGITTSVLYEGKPLAAGQIGNVPLTMEAAFAALLAGEEGATMEATWDPDLGFPVSVAVDPIPNAIDDEFSITIEDFAPTS